MRFFTSVYLLLLAYIIAILTFWGILLEKQNTNIFDQGVTILRNNVDSVQHPLLYQAKYNDLTQAHAMRTVQYVGEGTTFLIVILVGAVVVWSSFRRSMRLSKQQSNFMLSVTHELKSPIAAMKLNLQTLEKHKLDEEKRELLLERCIKEANRLNDLASNLLLASQIEGRQYKPATEQFDLSDMVEDAVRDYASRYPRSFIEDIQENCIITGDRSMLQMAVNNLLENAVKYTAPDKPIEVKVTTRHNTAYVQVADEGTGIPDEEKKKIFNKFYRVGSEESRKTKGTGLGLYITCKIVNQHKGRVTVKDNQPTGSVFEICLPLHQ